MVAAEAADPVITRLVEQDKVSWYKKKNLRVLYLLLLPTCIGIEMTSGFDSQMINAVQISTKWQICTSFARNCGLRSAHERQSLTIPLARCSV